MRKMIKRVLSMLLCLTMLLGAVIAIVPVSAAAEEVDVHNGTGTRGPVSVQGTLSYRAVINDKFVGFGFVMPTWNTSNGSCTISLYKWKDNYATTLSQSPVATKNFTNMADGAMQWVTFSEQAAGEYLFHISNATGTVGIWAYAGATNTKGCFYNNGTEDAAAQPEMKVRFASSAPAEPFGMISTAEKQVQTGTGTRGPVSVQGTLSYRAMINASFVGFGFVMPTWETSNGSCTISLYKWKDNYATTLAQSPVATKNFTNMADGAQQWVTFSEQAAGEYLFHISNATGTVGIWAYAGATNTKGCFYNNGVADRASEPDMVVRFASTAPAEPFGMISSNEANIWNGTGTREPIQVGNTVSYRAVVKDKFVGFGFNMPTWGTSNGACTISLYKWNGSYDGTLAQSPVATKSFTNMPDNTWQWVEFAEQEAGDYLFHISGPSGTVGIWKYSGVTDPKGSFFYNGTEDTKGEPEMIVRFANTAPAVPFGSIYEVVWTGDPQERTVQNGTGERTAIALGNTENDSLAYRAMVNGSFTGIGFSMPTWSTTDSSCVISVYRWNTDFATTVAGNAVATAKITNMADNQRHWANFNALPAGEYLFYISGLVGQGGVWVNDGATSPKGCFYINGEEEVLMEPDLYVHFEGTVPAEPFSRIPNAPTRIPKNPAVNPSGLDIAPMNESHGFLVDTNAAFDGVEFKVGTYLETTLEMTISVYKWDTDYGKTLKTTPVAEDRIILVDNQYNGIRFEELPAGKYLFLAQAPSGIVAMYFYPNASDYVGIVFKNGVSMTMGKPEYPVARLYFTEDLGSDPYFNVTSDNDMVIDGNHTSPDEYQIPADSLLNTHKVMPDTWVFTDGLGRVSLTNKEVGNPKDDKSVGMFYWTWHLSGAPEVGCNNLQELCETHPEIMGDFDNEMWLTLESWNAWNEPVYGYYRSDDEWVLRRQAELLANAGVDFILADNTNETSTWRTGYTALMEVWTDAQQNGAVDVPKVSFMLPFFDLDGSKQQLYSLYRDIYRTDKYQSLWYYLDGKPMMMADSSNFSAATSPLEKEILNFYTFRSGEPDYKATGVMGDWGWASTFPQALYWGTPEHEAAGVYEQMSVSVALNHNYEKGVIAAMSSGNKVMGRSYTSTYQDRYVKEGAEASKWGYCFSEQWNYALQVNPEIVFVTGWNERTAGRHEVWPEGKVTATENAFPDQFNDEYSRDIEPTRGALQDHYYYQLVNYVRQYKGANPIPTPSENVAILMYGDESQWATVEPYYASYIGNTDDRNAQGYGEYYKDTSGRNDIIGAQVARNQEYIYFHVECAENITAYSNRFWMNLYIDCDQDNQGWNTFDFVINKSAASKTTLVLEKFTADNDYSKTEKVADVEYVKDGRYMTVKVPKSVLGITGDDYTINFTWTDNVHDFDNTRAFTGDILDFYTSGDVAPGGRFKYSFISTEQNAGADVEIPVETIPGETEVETGAETDEIGTDEIESGDDVVESGDAATESGDDIPVVYETDEDGEVVTDESGEKVPVVYETDEDGEVVTDESGNKIPVEVGTDGSTETSILPYPQVGCGSGCGAVVVCLPALAVTLVGAAWIARKRED